MKTASILPEANQNLKRAALFVACVASFLTPFMASAVNVALRSIARDFQLDAVTLGWVTTAYLLAAAAFLLPIGRAADIVGRRRIFVAGLVIDALGSLLCSLAGGPQVLLAARVLQGLGGAMIFGTGVAIVSSVYPPGERGAALGTNVAAVYTGLSIGPTAGGLLTEYLGWRAVFAVGVPLALLAAAVAASQLRGEWAEARGERFDWLGSLLYGPALVLMMYGFSHLPGALGAALLAAGVALLAAFLAWQARCPAPILNVQLFRSNRPFAMSNLAALINYSATAAVGFLLSLYLQYLQGLSPKQAGLVLVVQPIVMTLVSPWAGRLSDRVEPRIVASLGMGLSATGLLLLQGLSADGSLSWVLFCLVVLGAGFGLFSSPNTNAIMSSVERRHYGVASGAMGTMRLTGQVFSMGVVMLMFAAYLDRQPIGPSNYPLFLASVRSSFALFTVLCLGGVFASLVRGRIHR